MIFPHRISLIVPSLLFGVFQKITYTFWIVIQKVSIIFWNTNKKSYLCGTKKDEL